MPRQSETPTAQVQRGSSVCQLAAFEGGLIESTLISSILFSFLSKNKQRFGIGESAREREDTSRHADSHYSFITLRGF